MLVTRIVDWIRAGYPQGMPQQDYVVVMGLLSRKLTREDVIQIAEALVADGEIDASHAQIAQTIEGVALQQPTPEDIRTVKDHLEAIAPVYHCERLLGSP